MPRPTGLDIPTKRTQKGFYAVRTGRKAGVFETWSDCEEQIKGFPKARFKKFNTFRKAEYFAMKERGSGLAEPSLARLFRSRLSRNRLFRSPFVIPRPTQFIELDMPTKRTQRCFYAVRTGRKVGVFDTWSECEEQVKSFPNARYKKFNTFEEAKYFALGVPPEDSIADASTSNWEPSVVVSNTRKRSHSFDESEWDVVYSDGACKGNGKVGSIAGIGVWWGPDDSRENIYPLTIHQAILRVLETAPISTKPLMIKTDSRYSIDCLKTWIFKWKKNGFLSARGEAVKNADIIRCTSIQLNIRATYPQKIRLQYVKGHSGDVGNDGADAMANRGTLLPAVEERDWETLEMKLSEQLKKSSAETNGLEPASMEVQDIDDDDVVEDAVVKIPSSKTSSDFHEHNTTMAVAASPVQCPALPASARPQNMPLESSATVSSTDFEIIPEKDYADCVLDDGDLANELSD